MPISDPATCRDKTSDWLAHFCAERLKTFGPHVIEGLMAEFERDPTGAVHRHSPALQQLLNFVRSVPIEGKTFVYVAKPDQDYRIGVMQGRGTAPVFVAGQQFRDEKAAICAALRHRLAALGFIARGAESGS